MAVTYDLPATFQTQATLIDANAGFGLQDANLPNSKVFVEKYVTKKQDYQFLPIGTPSEFHTQARLFAEEDFRDIGGGLMTFNRKYAQVPDPVTSLESVSVMTGAIFGFGGVSNARANFIGGELGPGRHYIDNDLVNVADDAGTQNVMATVYRTFHIAGDLAPDQGSEIMNIVREENLGSTPITYTTRTITFTLGGEPVINDTTTTQSRNLIGSNFAAGTVFRRQLVGRYLGDIMEVKEYALYNQVQLYRGKVLNGAAQTFAY